LGRDDVISKEEAKKIDYLMGKRAVKWEICPVGLGYHPVAGRRGWLIRNGGRAALLFEANGLAAQSFTVRQ
jgi:hypothetical protein